VEARVLQWEVLADSTGEQQLSTTPCVQCGAQHDPGASPCPEPSLVGRTLHAGIRVREQLRDTPLGPLYRAEYPTGLEVAVVLLGSTSADSGPLALLRQRYRDAIQIQHRNAAGIHELSETDDGLVYVVADSLTGELLSETLARRGALPLGEASELCLQTLLRRADAEPPIEQGVSLAGRRKLLRNLWPEQRVVAAVMVAVFAGLWLLWVTYQPGLDAPSRPRLEESESAAQREPDSISSSSASSAPARLRAKSGPASPVGRESVSGRVPTASGLPPASSSNAASDSLLVDVRSIDPTIQTDLRYATANNFTGAPLPGYEAPRALLRREAAAALGRVQARLRSKGLGLRVLDAYRPVRASVAMVDWAKRTGNRSLLEKGYIAERSRHNLGAAVDLTLVDLGTGTEVIGTTAFDNFTATADTANATGQALRYRQILLKTMASEGFSPYGQAWWHFNYPVEGAVPLDRVIR
jgi:D-alanyl-D-alanine dipeptidase